MNIPRRVVVVVLFLCLNSVRLAAQLVTATVTNCDEASLRAALASVSGFGGTVKFACDGTIVLTNTITLNPMSNVLLDGSGHNVVISGNQAVRVFALSGTSPGGFTLMNVTVANGVSEYGAGLLSGGFRPSTRLVNCTFSNNVAIGPPLEGGFGGGGGVVVFGGLAVENCSFLFNRTVVPGGNAISAIGFFTQRGFSLTVNNCTFYGNIAAANGGGAIYIGGGGIGSIATVANCTFHNNTNGAVTGGSNLTLRNTIASYTTASGVPNFSGGFIDGGYNLSSDWSGNFTTPGSLHNTDPLLGPLANNGGPTLTLALLSGSPAIDAVVSSNCPVTDQRGVARPYGARCDIGAFESAPPYAIFGSIAGYLSAPGGITVHAGTFTGSVGNDGSYQVHGLPPGPVTVVPAATNAVFVLSNQVVTLNTDVRIDFRSYQSNAFAIQRLTDGTIHSAFAGAVGETWRVSYSTNLFDWTPYSTNTVEASGLFEVFDNNSPQSQDQFFRGQKP